MNTVDFYKILADAGIPTTQAGFETKWREEMTAQESRISNDSAYSPFWRIVTAIITKPAVWLVQFIAETVFPNAFLMLATGSFLDILAEGYNLERKDAVNTEGKLTFSRVDLGGTLTVPAGTVAQTAAINGIIYEMITTADGTFSAGQAEIDVPAIAAAAGAAYNLGAGYYSILKAPIAGVTGVTNKAGWITIPGADQESDSDLRNRCRNQFGTASSFHIDAVYRSLIAQFPGVAVDAIYFEHDAPRGPGTANAFILFDFDAPVSDYLTAINQFITDQGNHGHGDDLIAYQMPEQTVDLDVTVWTVPNLGTAETDALEADVEDFIRAAFRENKSYAPTLTLPFARFSFSKLAAELHAQFPSLHSVEFSLPDIVTELWIPRLNSLDITMQVTE
jgi:uncharacterized phage protein gp47/JayE